MHLEPCEPPEPQTVAAHSARSCDDSSASSMPTPCRAPAISGTFDHRGTANHRQSKHMVTRRATREQGGLAAAARRHKHPCTHRCGSTPVESRHGAVGVDGQHLVRHKPATAHVNATHRFSGARLNARVYSQQTRTRSRRGTCCAAALALDLARRRRPAARSTRSPGDPAV
jgi:hypothetical protein